ncbi:MAG: hypothetical protein HY525_13440 [Betaproteobacteria bacterium]|nr:hypothetical protein [Betaproteobacteria bacterium]
MMHNAPKYGETEIPLHFRDLAIAYLECSERLCGEMADGAWDANFHRGQAVMWLAFHATELLLKGCIRRIAPRDSKSIHSLGKLLEVFSTHFPNVPFEPPFGAEAITGDSEAIEWALEVDRTLHERLRYPTNRTGSTWPGERAFAPQLFAAELKRLRADIERISFAVFGK